MSTDTRSLPLRGAGGATTHPSGASQWWRTSSQYWNQLTQVLSNNKVNEIKAGYYLYDWDITSLGSFRGGPPPNYPGGTYPIVSDHTTPDGSCAGRRQERNAWRNPADSAVWLQHRHADEPATGHRAEDMADS